MQEVNKFCRAISHFCNGQTEMKLNLTSTVPLLDITLLTTLARAFAFSLAASVSAVDSISSKVGKFRNSSVMHLSIQIRG